MKKKIFLSGVNAKLALAAVALTSVMFTSCEKEEFNVAPVELDPASATVAITVYDLSDGSIINGASITENGADHEFSICAAHQCFAHLGSIVSCILRVDILNDHISRSHCFIV